MRTLSMAKSYKHLLKGLKIWSIIFQVGKFQKKVSVTVENCSLYTLEVLYLWNALTQCPPEDVTRMMDSKMAEIYF